MRPNIILLVLDAARADAFEPYGAAPGSSPAVGDLARKGAAHPAAFAAASWTIPSHAAIFSGMLPRAAGMENRPGGGPHAYRPAMEALSDRLLPVVMQQAGYSTAAVSTNLWLTPESGFGIGFDEFITVDTGRQRNLHRSGRRARLAWALEAVRGRVDDGAAEAGSVFRRWLRSPPKRPFFWFANLVECHSPYLPPKPYNELGPVARWRAAKEARRYLTMGEIWRACAGGVAVPEAALERMRRLYAGAIRYLDGWIADLLESLEGASILEETLVIVTSDHGENFGEGGLMAHAFSLDDRLIRVPFVAAGPGAPETREAFSLAALPKLIASAAGFEHPPWANSLPPDGVAVAQFDPPAQEDDPRWEEAFREWGVTAEQAGPRVKKALICATDGRHKLLRRGADEEQLYDLEADPSELRPVPADRGPAELVARLRAALDHPASGPAAEPPPAATAAAEASAEELRELEDRMRLLGYL